MPPADDSADTFPVNDRWPAELLFPFTSPFMWFALKKLAKNALQHYHSHQINLTEEGRMSLPPCPKCASEYVYQDQELLICPECAHEWNPTEPDADDDTPTAKDANGTQLQDGDKVTFIKDLKVKGSSLVLKIGTKAVIRRIVEGKDHQLDCRVDGAGEMMITAAFVKKA